MCPGEVVVVEMQRNGRRARPWLLTRFPPRFGGPFRGRVTLLRRHLLCPCFAALQPAFSAERDSRRVLSYALGRVLNVARSDIYDELAELVGITGRA